jgi:hypothetical protein
MPLISTELALPLRGGRTFFHYCLITSVGILTLALFLYAEWQSTGRLDGVTLDDSWIHYRFASNLRQGHGFSFNLDEPTPGSTSPLWVLALSLIDQGFLIPSKVLGILSFVGCGLVVYKLGRFVGLRAVYSILAGISTLVAGRFAWAAPSGMETTTFAFASLVALWLWGRDGPEAISPLTSITFGAACLLRPEGYLLLTLSGLSWIVTKSSRWKERRTWINLARHFAIAGLLVLPYPLFSLITAGHLLPTTFYAKTSAWNCHPGPKYFAWTAAVFLLDNPVMALMAGVGLLCILGSKAWRVNPSYSLGAAWLFALPAFYGFIAPCISGYYMRYTTPLVPVMMFFGAAGAGYLERLIPRWIKKTGKVSREVSPQPGLVTALMAEGSLLALVPLALFWAPFYGQSVADIENMQVRIAGWLAHNTPAGSILALNDIGAIGYLTESEVIDLGGLITPEIQPLIAGKVPGEWDQALAGYLVSRQPDYLSQLVPASCPIVIWRSGLRGSVGTPLNRWHTQCHHCGRGCNAGL